MIIIIIFLILIIAAIGWFFGKKIKDLPCAKICCKYTCQIREKEILDKLYFI